MTTKQTIDTFDADAWPIEAFGIIKEGGWSANGLPTGWHVGHDLDERLPRWMEDQPTMKIQDSGVYLRGMYSRRLTELSRKAKSA